MAVLQVSNVSGSVTKFMIFILIIFCVTATEQYTVNTFACESYKMC